MAIPTKTTLQTLTYSGNGEPFVRVASKSSQDADGLVYSKDGSPFWFIEESGGVTYNIAKINGVAIEGISKVNGISLASLSKLNGVSVTV